MNTIHFRAPLAAAACACLFASVAGAQTPAGAWAKVPALPTACYDGSDGFADKVEAARAALAADIERQKGVNAGIEEQFNAIDPMEKAQRMQQWMMSNPQEAARMFGAQQQAGAQAQAENPAINAEHLKFNAERESLKAGYQAALKEALAPANAKYAALDKRLSDAGCGFSDTECSVPASAYAERDVIFRERDAAYQANCLKFWTDTGSVAGFAKRYRAFLADKWVSQTAGSDEAMRSQFAIMDTPGAAWRSTVPDETADRYLREIGELYALRDDAPTCTAQECPR